MTSLLGQYAKHTSSGNTNTEYIPYRRYRYNGTAAGNGSSERKQNGNRQEGKLAHRAIIIINPIHPMKTIASPSSSSATSSFPPSTSPSTPPPSSSPFHHLHRSTILPRSGSLLTLIPAAKPPGSLTTQTTHTLQVVVHGNKEISAHLHHLSPLSFLVRPTFPPQEHIPTASLHCLSCFTPSILHSAAHSCLLGGNSTRRSDVRIRLLRSPFLTSLWVIVFRRNPSRQIARLFLSHLTSPSAVSLVAGVSLP